MVVVAETSRGELSGEEKGGVVAGCGGGGEQDKVKSGHVGQTMVSLFRVRGQGLNCHQGPGDDSNVWTGLGGSWREWRQILQGTQA